MNDVFTKFYSAHTKEIHDFLDSPVDILYVSGFSGSGKSSVAKNALKTYQKGVLKFHHLCFKDTVIDDFLLSFYDSFREHAIKQNITLKKNPEEGFMDKVSFYFKNLEYPAVVLIDNFEIISDDSEITDFLLHISSFPNVKLIVISKNPSCRLIENPTVSIDRIDFEKISYEEFEKVLSGYFADADTSLLKELYDACDGYELYIKMVVTYLDSVNMSLSDFLEEFKLKEIPFSDYLVEKQVSLIPNNYYSLLENLSCIYHNIPAEFITQYSLGDDKQLPYLVSKFAVSEFYGTFYIKTYLRKYFADNISLQNKISIFNKLPSIYENELKKSPKDRILRLSRESIRKQIALLEEKAPKVAKYSPAPQLDYAVRNIANNSHWFITGAGSSKKATSKFEQLKQQAKQRNEEKNRVIEQKINEPVEPSPLEKSLGEVLRLESEYRYKEALQVLTDAKSYCKNLHDKISVYSKMAHNSIKINDNNAALSYLRELCEFCSEEGDLNQFARFRMEIGKIYKKLYAFSRAKNCFEEIINKPDGVSKNVLGQAELALAEIFELENDFERSIAEYKKSFEIIVSENDKSPLLPEICYKTASLYDENEYYEEALVEYGKSIQYAETSQNEIYLTKAYTNSGVILADMGQTQDALNYLEYSLELTRNSNNYIDTYYIARNIAEIYKNIEPEKSFDYLTMALDYAKLSENSFEIAISLLELGDYYYDAKQNEQALICYFQAKATLGASASRENTERVTTRINDMKIKLGNYIFNGMKQLYDPD